MPKIDPDANDRDFIGLPFYSHAKGMGKIWRGTGETNNPYRIVIEEDLNDIGNHKEEDLNKHFILINDVNLVGYTGTQFNIIGADWSNAFRGVFDGNDHKIWNFTWSSTDRNYQVGLFGCVGRKSVV